MKRVIALTILLFFLVQVGALLVGSVFTQQNISAVENPASADNSFYFFGMILVFAVVLLFVLKHYKGKMLFQILELAMVFSAVQLFASAFVNMYVAAGIAIVAVGVRYFVPKSKNAILMLTVAIIAGLLGASLDIVPAGILAVLLAGYDIVAVFFTKHMVTLAKNLGKRDASFSIKVSHGKETLELGTGDLVIPAMLIVAANRIGKVAVGSGLTGTSAFTWPAILGLVGAVVGISVLMVFLEKHRGYWPALPPVVVGSILGVLAGFYL